MFLLDNTTTFMQYNSMVMITTSSMDIASMVPLLPTAVGITSPETRWLQPTRKMGAKATSNNFPSRDELVVPDSPA